MTECVTVSIVSSLGGFKNSNPQIIQIHPNTALTNSNETLEKCLPNGSIPGQFYENELEKNKILVYVFEIERDDERNDLTSIGFSMDKNAVVDSLKEVIRELISRMKKHNILNLEILSTELPKILVGLQKESKIKIGSMIFDIKNFLKTNKIVLKNKERKVRGAIL